MEMSGEKVLATPEAILPHGFAFRLHDGSEDDILHWCRIETEVDEFDSQAEAREYFMEEFYPHMDDVQKRCTFIINNEGLPIATASGWFSHDKNGDVVNRLHWVAVCPKYQGLGLGKAITTKAVNVCAKLAPGKEMWLSTQTHSHRAVVMYHNLGFNMLAGHKEYTRAIQVLASVLAPEKVQELKESAVKLNIAPLFNGWEEVAILSYMQGHMGQAWADDEDTPTVAKIESEGVCYIAGDATSPQARELLRQIPIDMELQANSEAWHQLVAEELPNTTYPITRYKFKKDPALFDKEKLQSYAKTLPKDYAIAPIDEAMFSYLPTTGLGGHCMQFASYANFQKYGAGFVVLHEGEPVCVASPATYCDSFIDIQIDTHPKHRRKGLATACATNLILECLAKGIFPCWDADCDESKCLAEKLGYQLEREAVTYDVALHKLIYEANDLFKNCGFDYCICGGFALDMFAGREIRKHGDFDISFFKEDRVRAIKFLMDNEWPVYARTELREFFLVIDPNDSRLTEMDNMWAVKPGSFANMLPVEGKENVYTYKIVEPRLQGFDFIEISFDARENGSFVIDSEDGKGARVWRALDKAILHKHRVPYMSPELILFLKSHPFNMEHEYLKPKTQNDFPAVLPMLSDEQRQWLLNALSKAWPDGYGWLDGLL